MTLPPSVCSPATAWVSKEEDGDADITDENTGDFIERRVDIPGPVRLDRWLADQVSELSRNQVQRLIQEGAVQVNGVPCDRKKAPISQGDRVSLQLPDAAPYELIPEAIPLEILYEDEQLIILNKPAGMVVHPAPGHDTGTLVHALLFHCGNQLTGVGGIQRPGIVHRLDKNTTGAIVVAKTQLALQHLQAQIQSKQAQREYLGIVHGIPNLEAGSIDLPVGRHPKHRKKMAVVSLEQGGRPARTHWRLLERLGNYSLIHFRLDTGRTHQIRVHSSHIGHPLVGDPDYSAGKSPGVKLTGQALHAFRLSLYHPIRQIPLSVEAPLPASMTKLLNKLRH